MYVTTGMNISRDTYSDIQGFVFKKNLKLREGDMIALGKFRCMLIKISHLIGFVGTKVDLLNNRTVLWFDVNFIVLALV